MKLSSFALAGAAVSAAALACSSSSSPSSSDASSAACVVATSCPDAGAPSYAAVIRPILEGECIACHSPSGTAGYDETTYAQVAAQASAMLDQVNGCMMPPVNGPSMSDAQRVALTEWLRCGAPDN
jgi:uncharacterized membrane protein